MRSYVAHIQGHNYSYLTAQNNIYIYTDHYLGQGNNYGCIHCKAVKGSK